MTQEPNSVADSPGSPSKNTLDPAEYDLLLPGWSLDGLKAAATQLCLSRPRSLAWAILLHAVPPPQGDIVKSMTIHREYYEDLKSKLSMDPRAVIGDDPLSQNEESAWKQHFCDNELKALILQDVVRTFPDEMYFRDKHVQDMMVRILFFWARSHTNIGYRQGMHEILAPLLFELHMDRKYAPSILSDTLKHYLDSNYMEHDSYMLFNSVMKGLEKFYSTGDIVPTACGRMPPSTTLHNPTEVVRYLEKVKEEYLVQVDPELATHLADCNITMELFGIRWLRLLWGREFPRAEVPQLWGFLFSAGPLLPDLHYVFLAMLVAQRNILLDGDPGAALGALMRPCAAGAAHVCALARHLRAPRGPRPKPPPPTNDTAENLTSSSTSSSWTVEQAGIEGTDSGSEGVAEGVAEGADVARDLAALALLRATLPRAAAALAAALPKPAPEVARPLQQILQLAALLQCRNHALIDVETALEAAEGQNQNIDNVGRKQIVPVAMIGGRRQPPKQKSKPVIRVKEVQLKLFNQMECDSTSDLPCLDPLRLRTE